jgi:hypothetical protein
VSKLPFRDPGQQQVLRLLRVGALWSLSREGEALGIFGSPTFVVGEEIFWGDDRFEDALDWSLKRE